MPDKMRRITLIVRDLSKPDVDWNYMSGRASRVVFVDTPAILRFAIRSGLADISLDIERVIVDRAVTPEEFLALLAEIPGELAADILYMRDDGSAFLSAMGRGGDRLLYSLGVSDVRFYLEAHDLVTGRVTLGREVKATALSMTA